MTAPISEARLRHLARQIHALGPRVLAELLIEHLARGGDLRCRLERYAEINPAALIATGGDRFAPRLAVLEGGRR